MYKDEESEKVQGTMTKVKWMEGTKNWMKDKVKGREGKGREGKGREGKESNRMKDRVKGREGKGRVKGKT